LIETPPSRRHQVNRPRGRDELDGSERRLRSEHHSSPATERSVIDGPMCVGRAHAKVMDPNVD
jgi:hypothetical protein